MKIFRIFIIAVILIIAAIIVYNKFIKAPDAIKDMQAGAQKELQVMGYVVKLTKLSNTVEAGGTLLAAEQVNLQPEISEKIKYINFREGAFAGKGTLLVKLNDDDFQAQLKKLNVQKQIAEKTEQRLRQLLSANGIGQQEYDNALLTLDNIKADIEIVQTQIEKTEIRAPFSGKLGLRNVSMGAMVNPNTILTSIQQVDSLKIDFFIPEKYGQCLKPGDIVRFRTDVEKNQLTGKVYAIETSVDESSRSIQVRAMFDNRKNNLQPGSFVKVMLDLKDIPETIMIPSQAIIPEAKGKKVVVCENGKAVFKKVITGFRSESEVQITEGLQEGDTVVTTGILYLKPDLRLKFKKMQN
jgi:membrane fusion protein, multidrug efflux system